MYQFTDIFTIIVIMGIKNIIGIIISTPMDVKMGGILNLKLTGVMDGILTGITDTYQKENMNLDGMLTAYLRINPMPYSGMITETVT